MLPWLNASIPHFPDTGMALDEPDGLLAAGGELSPTWLVSAYRQGIFPWYSEGDPILWWSPNPRMVLFPEAFKQRRSLTKRLRHGGFRVTLDQQFDTVINACAAPRRHESGTWITQAMQEAYCQLHRCGIAHSIEVTHQDRLVGGLYGLALGPVFFGESMFSHQPDASKVALAYLCAAMRQHGGKMIDCQMHTPHLASLGAGTVAREAFINYLKECLPSQAFTWPASFSEAPTVPSSPWLDALAKPNNTDLIYRR
ncbi:leucyl/phenylalanyl-tRNA--protein transferase [Halomonas vilamensis]|uniref:Leucyl/phenylalanyl-tRNA--protein transferase n=1 Tax=Vreelandella vilamensis TaxID=531309 RepID=A0ABU1H0S1_9GAMM|nr:leucyl/phenylalanyl-tRNA--protein transferase [Halomonas vilamensis]MDR5897893.1 leucyl/phenylalanyl-tRNA--protein transferase [Halomonas vilamensis]